MLPLHSISSQQFLLALANGSPVYDAATLRGYVREDLLRIEQIKPDLIVGAFRLSLSVSARLVGFPDIAITNAYWSPYAGRVFPLPVLPMTRFLPLSIAEALFNLARSLACRLNCNPLNLRMENGLPSLGTDLRRVCTDADCTLNSDIPALFPTENLPTTYHYLGPDLWSPPVGSQACVVGRCARRKCSRLWPCPVWCGIRRPDCRRQRLLLLRVAGLGQTPPLNVYIADYLPGIEAATRSKLVICNGGSPTSQPALAAGVPVLGIASNMDQFLNMGAVCGHCRLTGEAEVIEKGARNLSVEELHARFNEGGRRAVILPSTLPEAPGSMRTLTAIRRFLLQLSA